MAAKAALEQLIPPGSDLIIEVPSRQADELGDLLTFGRVLGRVTRPGDSENLSETLCRLGLASREKP